MIKSFEDIKNIDSKLASLFLRPELALDWIQAIEGDISKLVKNHNKPHWEIVRYVSQQRGILGKYKVDNKTIMLTRKDFASILFKFCPAALHSGETIDKLKTSMEHYQYIEQLRRIWKTPDNHIVYSHIKEVEDIFDNNPIVKHEEARNQTMEDYVLKYLKKVVNEATDHFPCSRICIRPQYEHIQPAISIETFKSKKFMENNMPSFVEAYEFIDEKLTERIIYELSGKYSGNNTVKLFVVSSNGMHPDVRKLALEKNIGFILTDMNKEITQESFMLPRSIEDYAKQRHNIKILTGEHPLNTPMLIMNGNEITSSLTDVLYDDSVVVKTKVLKIPFLTEEFIEKKANNITHSGFAECMRLYHSQSGENIDFAVDPFECAKEVGLENDFEELDESQLGLLDVKNNHVTLNINAEGNYERIRFTMAHECGHYVLHTKFLKSANVTSIGETDNTITVSNDDRKRLEYQANKFASFLLMPQERIEILYYFLFQKFVHSKFGDSLQPIYYSPTQPETYYSYENVVGNMARILKVSRQALEIRLKAMNLLRIE